MKRAADLFNRLSIEHIWVLVIGAGIIAFLNTHPVLQNDFWWHMAIGREILASGRIPQVDIYSFTAAGLPYPSYNQFWLMDVVLYAVYSAGGIILIVLFQMVVVASAYALVLRQCYRVSQNWRAAAFGLLFAAAMGMGNWNVRPQAVAYLYAAVFVTLIDRLRSKPDWRWLPVFLVGMTLWVNSHGTFPIGFALLGIWGLDVLKTVFQQGQKENGIWDFKPLFWPAASAFLALAGCLINPTGLGFLTYLTNMTGSQVIQNFVGEWMPSTFATLDGAIFLSGLLLLSVVLMLSPKRPSLPTVLAYLVFSFLALKYLRSVVWFGLFLGPAAAEHLGAWMNSRQDSRSPVRPTRVSRMLNIMITVVLFLFVVISLPWFKHLLPLTPEKAALISPETPIKATQYLLEHKLPGPVFHAMPYGSYLIWAAQPVYKVFVDSRIELYSEKTWQDYFLIFNAVRGWDEKLAEYGIQTLLLEVKTQPELKAAVEASGEWKLVYQDNYVLLYTRK